MARIVAVCLLTGSIATGVSECGYSPGERALTGGNAGVGALVGGGIGALGGTLTAPGR